MNALAQELLKNDVVIMQALGLVLHHIGHLQQLVDQIPGARLTREEKMAESVERMQLIDMLADRKEQVGRVLKGYDAAR